MLFLTSRLPAARTGTNIYSTGRKAGDRRDNSYAEHQAPVALAGGPTLDRWSGHNSGRKECTPIQEEVENKTIALTINGAKLTGRMLRSAIAKYLAHRKEVKMHKARASPVIPHGKQAVKQLVGQGQGVSNIEITDPSIKEFDRIARKYVVDYAIKRNRSSSPPKFLIFFKSKDASAITAAFTEYAGKKIQRAKKPSLRQKLAHFKSLVKKPVMNREKRKKQTR